jgi:hypothetical protein
VENVVNRVSRTEDKVENLDQTEKECYENMNGRCKISGTP